MTFFGKPKWSRRLGVHALTRRLRPVAEHRVQVLLWPGSEPDIQNGTLNTYEPCRMGPPSPLIYVYGFTRLTVCPAVTMATVLAARVRQAAAHLSQDGNLINNQVPKESGGPLFDSF